MSRSPQNRQARRRQVIARKVALRAMSDQQVAEHYRDAGNRQQRDEALGELNRRHCPPKPLRLVELQRPLGAPDHVWAAWAKEYEAYSRTAEFRAYFAGRDVGDAIIRTLLVEAGCTPRPGVRPW